MRLQGIVIVTLFALGYRSQQLYASQRLVGGLRAAKPYDRSSLPAVREPTSKTHLIAAYVFLNFLRPALKTTLRIMLVACQLIR